MCLVRMKEAHNMAYGLGKTRLYSIYYGMKSRCYNPNDSHYQWYSTKGITICDKWVEDNGLQNFFEWFPNNGYDETLTIDRKDSSKNYSPDNCQWITRAENTSHAVSKTYPQVDFQNYSQSGCSLRGIQKCIILLPAFKT